MRVLLIEDNLKLVQTLSQSLGALGIQVEAEGDGRAGRRGLAAPRLRRRRA
jgi:DNA-binding response OmpR family regulator